MSESNIKAVLVRITIRIVPNSRQDPTITDEVRLQTALGKGAGKWVKYMLPESSFAAIRAAGGDFRRRHYDLTLPWEEGYRLLPSGGHEKYETEFAQHAAKFETAKEEFGARYSAPFVVDADSIEAAEYVSLLESVGRKGDIPKGKQFTLPCLVDQARLMHNGTFDESLYPEWRFLKQRFSIGMEFTPVPKASHFITGGIAKDAIEEMRDDLERRNNDRVQAAVQDTWTRLMTPVQNIAEKLSDQKTIFRDSLIENVKEIVGLIPQLNLTNDAELTRTARVIEERFANLDPAVLREDVSVRRQVSKAAKELVSSFGKIGKRRFA
ncbi:MAG: hypothetical protein ACTHLW_21025 [Verrucomicrobiota bacterium]